MFLIYTPTMTDISGIGHLHEKYFKNFLVAMEMPQKQCVRSARASA
jgi:hypothetical protein